MECSACTWFNGRRRPCTKAEHRCQRRNGAGTQCQWAVEPGTAFCQEHVTRALSLTGGRKALLADAQLVEAIRRHEAGEIWEEIAKSVGISNQGLSASVKRYKERTG